MLPQADLFRHVGEIAARQLDLPELLRPVCTFARDTAANVLQRRIAQLHCPQSPSANHVCAALCSVCRWRFAHQCSLELVASADETPCELTKRRASPEFNTTVSADETFAGAVVAVLLDGTLALTPLALALQSMLLIRRQQAPDELLWPLFRLALLHVMAEMQLPTRLAAHPDLIALLTRSNQRIFYLLTLYFVSVVARTECIAPWKRIDGYDDRIQQVRDALPRVVVDLSCDGQLGSHTNSCVNGVNYVRAFRLHPELAVDTSVRRSRLAAETIANVPASQALYVRCCGRLALCTPAHPRTAALLEAMRGWSLRERGVHDACFEDLGVRYICLGCMTADAPVVLDPRGVVFCMNCSYSNVVWVNPVHLILEKAAVQQRVARRTGPQSCVVGPHVLRSSDRAFPVLDGAVLCEEHARSHAWLAAVDPDYTPLVRRLLSSRRPSETYARSAPRSARPRT